MKSVLEKLSYALFPRRCRMCGEVVEFDKKFCRECENINVIKLPVCLYCGVEEDKCVCKKKKCDFNGIVAPFYYEGNIAKAVHRFKFREMTELADEFTLRMYNAVCENYSEISFDFVTAVPLGKKRLKKRGYNQAEILARGIAKRMEIDYNTVLYKAIENKEQHKQSQRERKANVFGVYDLTENADVEGKTVLLVDDVKTTGATLSECAKMLKLYGAKEVYCVAFAVVSK